MVLEVQYVPYQWSVVVAGLVRPSAPRHRAPWEARHTEPIVATQKNTSTHLEILFWVVEDIFVVIVVVGDGVANTVSQQFQDYFKQQTIEVKCNNMYLIFVDVVVMTCKIVSIYFLYYLTRPVSY